MNRILLQITLGVLLGVVLPKSAVLYIILFSVLAVLYLVVLLVKKSHAAFPFIAGLVLGVIALSFAGSAQDSILYNEVNKNSACVVEVNSVPEIKEGYTKFYGKIIKANGKETSDNVLVYVYDAPGIYENTILSIEKLKITLPQGQQNFKGFDYRKYLSGKGIYFKCSCGGKDISKVENSEMNFYRQSIKLNSFLCKRIETVLDSEPASLFKAVLLGDKTDLSEENSDFMRKSGLSHVIAVSGLHLSVIIMLLGVFLRFFNKKLRLIIIAAVVFSFAFVTGLSASVVRAAIMLVMLYIADAFLLEGDSLTNLALSALIFLLINPNCIYDTGFVLSYSATLGILCICPYLVKLFPKNMPGTLKECIAVTLSAQIGTFPFMIMSFGYVSLFSVISNLLIVVLLPCIYVFGGLALLFGTGFFKAIAQFFIHGLINWAKLCSAIPGQLTYIPQNFLTLFGAFLFTATGLVIFSIRRKKAAMWVMLASLIAVLTGTAAAGITPANTELTFINVGQAECALVQTADGYNFLVDTGTEYAASSEVVDYLFNNGVYSLDGIFVSHFDSDHSGGLETLLENVKAKTVYIPETADVGGKMYEFIKYSNGKDINVISLKKGDTVKAGMSEIASLSPAANQAKDENNDSSLVFRLDNKDVSALFPGDIQDDSKLENCDTDILKVSHHGSKNGSTEEFLKINTPKIAVISLGENNSNGFPKPETLKKLNLYTHEIFRTDLNGTVKIKCKNKNYETETLK